MMRWLLWLGNGRALEAYLAGLKLLFVVFLLWPNGETLDVRALADLPWYGIPLSAIAAPFMLAGSIQLIGLILNIRGFELSWVFRAVGSGLGIVLWAFLIIKSIAIGAIITLTLPVAIMGIMASTFLFWKAQNRLPIPGTVGLP